jgi:hypothetical protein
VMIHEGRRMSKKRLGIASVLSGLLNGAQAYLVNYLMPQTTTRIGGGTFPGGGTFTGAGTSAAASTLRQFSELTYTITSVIVGILIPLVILGIAMFRSRSKRSEDELGSENEELESEDSTLKK